MTQPKAKPVKKSAKIREELATVQIFARTGRLPIKVPYDEWINPTTKRTVPGVVLLFDERGLCELDPVRDAETIREFRAWMEDGTDFRIASLGVTEIKDAIIPPFPKWDSSKPEVCIDAVETLGLDAEHCLRYELTKLARPKVVKSLEAAIDEPAADDPLAEPEL
jgi:hypothetical protein